MDAKINLKYYNVYDENLQEGTERNGVEADLYRIDQGGRARVLAFLKSKGINLDVESVDAMIESAVYELTHGFLEVGEAVEVVEAK